MYHDLVVLYKDYSNYASGSKAAPPRSHKFYIGSYWENLHKHFLGDSVHKLFGLSCPLFSNCASHVERSSTVIFWPISEVSDPGPSEASCYSLLVHYRMEALWTITPPTWVYMKASFCGPASHSSASSHWEPVAMTPTSPTRGHGQAPGQHWAASLEDW